MGNLKKVEGELTNWSRSSLGDLDKRISRVKKDLEACRRKDISHEQVQREHLLRYKLEKLEKQRIFIGSKGRKLIGSPKGIRIRIFPFSCFGEEKT
jgi:hypothetical protein